jgi:hypothetical protein
VSLKVSTLAWCSLSSLFVGYQRLFYLCMVFTADLQLVAWLRMGGSLLLLPWCSRGQLGSEERLQKNFIFIFVITTGSGF